jgi:DNA-binding MarR family transcriptional regulator
MQLTHADNEVGNEAPTVEVTAERLMQVLMPIFKRVMAEARMQIPGEFCGESQFRIIHALSHRDYTISELAEQMQVRAPTVSRMVDTLTERGYVDRHPDPTDRRKVWLHLTDTGRVLAQDSQAVLRRTVARFLGPLDGADRNLIVAACDRLETLLTREAPTGSKGQLH